MNSSRAKVEGRKTTPPPSLARRLTAAWSMWWLSGLIGLLLVGSVASIYFFISRPAAVLEFLGSHESFEITYEFLLVTVLGGLLALVYKQIDLRREQRHSLRQMHTELLDAYNRAKSVRRRMRARLGTESSVNPATTITADYYGEQMEALSEAQLIFEIYVKRTKGALWFWRAPHLARSLNMVEAYLNGIVKEHEEQLSTFGGEPPAKKIGELGKLTEFIGPFRKGTNFQTRFKEPFRDALATLEGVTLR